MPSSLRTTMGNTSRDRRLQVCAFRVYSGHMGDISKDVEYVVWDTAACRLSGACRMYNSHQRCSGTQPRVCEPENDVHGFGDVAAVPSELVVENARHLGDDRI